MPDSNAALHGAYEGRARVRRASVFSADHAAHAPMKTILVVDDERNIIDLLRLYLEKEGFTVAAAFDGEEALAFHARHDPDLVILDLMLPKVDGFEVCREIRRRGDTPILILTARSDDVD